LTQDTASNEVRAPASGEAATRFSAHLRLAAPALTAYLVARLVGLVVLWAMARHYDEHTLELLGEWDGVWFIGIVQDGYDTSLEHGADGSLIPTNIVFFPGYPFLVKAFASVTGLGVLHAGILAAWVAGLAAAWGIFAVGYHIHGRTVGTLLAILWAVQPHAIVESMVYSEGLFTALAAWCLYAVLRRRWLTAGVLCGLAGTTRASAIVLVVIVVVMAAIEILRQRSDWRPWAAALISPIGLAGYYAWVGHVLGRADGWFYMQDQGWGSRFDGGRDTLETFVEILATRGPGLERYEVSAVVLASIVLVVWLVFLRTPWPLVAYAGGLLILTIGAGGYYHSKSRFLLPAFPLLLPFAIAFARMPRNTLAFLLPSLALASALYGGYLLLIWPWSF
jgi:hypothetical protein